MRVVAALGGNALLKRGEPLSAANQLANVRRAAAALAPLAAAGHQLVVTHGNGPQVGLLALQSAAGPAEGAQPLDVLDAESEGMIGYLIERELGNALGPGAQVATLLTQVRVDPADPAFAKPTKPIGPVYTEAAARALGLPVAADGKGWRRVVASPKPVEIVEAAVIARLVDAGITVVCTGGGGIPVARGADGRLDGIEAVVDKDLASALLARSLKADALLMLTDVAAVSLDWGTPRAREIARAHPDALAGLGFAAGSMGPKVEAAIGFARASGGRAAIGRLEDAAGLLDGSAGTTIDATAPGLLMRPAAGQS
ncbi:carbamate kinase [Zavarzinia sp.]|uniref:carbamate kinase n=1 Tax=Zavarzinia sp. TaxID=2027920 RepID=UPI0035628825